jgi:type IX secretion system PorP/SprF family membrane protein
MVNSLLKYFLLVSFLMFFLPSTGQQDPIFTQYMFNTQVVNPAYAGIWKNQGFFTLVRTQWTGVKTGPLTQMISLFSSLKKDNVGVGLNIMKDRFSKEERLSIFGDYSYEVLITPYSHLRLGLKFGFMKFQNSLSQYQLIDNAYDPAFQEDIDLKFLPNFGVGGFFYSDKYYLSLSIPKLIENNFLPNRSNYSSLAEVRHLYLSSGYVFDLGYFLKFKPTMMMRVTLGVPVNLDFSANFLLKEQLWLGAMYRTDDALCFIAQWMIHKNMKIGYAMDITMSDLYKNQLGTYEFTFSYDIDIKGRRNIRSRYF